jgi:hypothetical protein
MTQKLSYHLRRQVQWLNKYPTHKSSLSLKEIRSKNYTQRIVRYFCYVWIRKNQLKALTITPFDLFLLLQQGVMLTAM